MSKCFPGYVLIKMILTEESWHIVRNVRGVTGFVGSTSEPLPLTQAEIDKLASRFDPVEAAAGKSNYVKLRTDTLKIVNK